MDESFFNFFYDQAPQIARQTLSHINLVVLSLFFATLVGLPLGLWLAQKRKVATIILGFTGVLQTIPSIALLGLMIPIWGIGVHTAIAALFLYALLPIVRNTITGLNQVDPTLREAAAAMGMTSFQQLWKIEIPLALPVIFAGIRTAAVINVGVATLAAYVAAGGLGEFIFGGIALNNTNMILAGAIPAALLAIIFDMLLEKIQHIPVRTLKKVLLLFSLIGLASIVLWKIKFQDSKKLRAGFAHEFAGRQDGYPGLQKVYGLKLSTVLIDQSLMYKVLYKGDVDLISGYSTDGRIKAYQLRVLKDDKHAFPPYQAALLVKQNILKKFPELKSVLGLLDNKISDSTMTVLNFEVEILHRTPERVAYNFIKSAGLLGNSNGPEIDKITVGSKIFTEQYILAEILKLLIESHTDIQVVKKTGLGGTKICFASLQQGSIDLYPEYTGTALLVLLAPDQTTIKNLNNQPELIFNFLKKEFTEKFHLEFTAPLGFNNAYCLMMRDQKARELKIDQISDLIDK